MRLLLDECIGDRLLTDRLAAAGHDVVRTVDELGGGADDQTVFTFACESNRSLMTYNCADFVECGKASPQHPGLILIYQDNKLSDMNTSAIVQALSNLAAAFPNGIADAIVVLNAYRW